jgi:hypothetical protein
MAFLGFCVTTPSFLSHRREGYKFLWPVNYILDVGLLCLVPNNPAVWLAVDLGAVISTV